MDYNNTIEKAMAEINSGSSDPFIIYRDKNGEWHCEHTQNQYGDTFDWVDGIPEIDPFAITSTANDYSQGSYAYVYNTILANRIDADFTALTDPLMVLGGEFKQHKSFSLFVEAYISEFPKNVMAYLTTLDRPYKALREMCPLNMTTYYKGWNFNEELAQKAISLIERAVNERVQRSEYDPSPDDRSIEGYTEKQELQIAGNIVYLMENPHQANTYLVRTRSSYGECHNILFAEDYLDAVHVYTRQIAIITEQLKAEQNKSRLPVHKLTNEDCIPNENGMDWISKVIIVKPECLAPEYRSAEHQLIFCSHGSGARPNAIGTSVFGEEVYSGVSVCYGRHEIEGIADTTRLPYWAVSKIALIEALKERGIFEFGGYHFKPYRKFEKRDSDWKSQVSDAKNNRDDVSIKTEKAGYSHSGFCNACADSGCDIYKCLENGKLYIATENTLYQYIEPQKKQLAKVKKPSLLDRLKDAKTEAAALNAGQKATVKLRKRSGMEVI